MAKRISMDAIIVLRNAGYKVEQVGEKLFRPKALRVYAEGGPFELSVNGGTVDNDQVQALLDSAK